LDIYNLTIGAMAKDARLRSTGRGSAARAATALPGRAEQHELVHLPGEIVAGDRGLARARMTDLSFLAAKETLRFKSSKQGIRPAGKFDPRISAQDDLHQIQTYE
jgi:hypothetical protein